MHDFHDYHHGRLLREVERVSNDPEATKEDFQDLMGRLLDFTRASYLPTPPWIEFLAELRLRSDLAAAEKAR
jgi:hypothetical protein